MHTNLYKIDKHNIDNYAQANVTYEQLAELVGVTRSKADRIRILKQEYSSKRLYWPILALALVLILEIGCFLLISYLQTPMPIASRAYFAIVALVFLPHIAWQYWITTQISKLSFVEMRLSMVGRELEMALMASRSTHENTKREQIAQDDQTQTNDRLHAELQEIRIQLQEILRSQHKNSDWSSRLIDRLAIISKENTNSIETLFDALRKEIQNSIVQQHTMSRAEQKELEELLYGKIQQLMYQISSRLDHFNSTLRGH